MIAKKYQLQIKKILNPTLKKKKIQCFIFGSSVTKDHFADIDIGVIGDITEKDIYDLKEVFEDSTLPFFVDVINFRTVSKKFRENVFDNPIMWIKR